MQKIPYQLFHHWQTRRALSLFGRCRRGAAEAVLSEMGAEGEVVMLYQCG